MSLQPNAPIKPFDSVVQVELEGLANMPIAQLRGRYKEVYRAEPPKAFGPDLLRRSIAQRLQEKAYGGLSRSTQRLLDQMMKAYAAKPNGRIILPRRIKPGSVLVRIWKGNSHRVMVLADGFAYDGKTHTNLSEIAGLITGTNWNGPRFFGLRPKAPESSEPAASGRSHAANGKAGAASPRSRHSLSRNGHRRRDTSHAVKSVSPNGDRHGG